MTALLLALLPLAAYFGWTIWYTAPWLETDVPNPKRNYGSDDARK